MQKELTIKKDYSKVGEQISHQTAAEFIMNYGKTYATDIRWFCMGKDILMEILNQPGCAGMRFYNGINEKGQKTLVYVGMDKEGNDIIERTAIKENGDIVMEAGVVADRNGGGLSTSIWDLIFGK